MATFESFIECYLSLSTFLSDSTITLNDIAFLEATRQRPNATQAEIAQQAALPRSSASRIMIKLLDLSLISERLAPADTRASHVKITSRGENVLFEAAHATSRRNLADFALDLAFFNNACRALSLPRQEAIVIALAAQRGSIENLTLRDALGAKPSSLSSTLQSLRHQGYANTRPCATNRRRAIIHITAKGRKIATDLAQRFEQPAVGPNTA